MGLWILIGLIAGCYLLFRSFLTHLKRVPASFDDAPGDAPDDARELTEPPRP